ncbi:MAG: DNA methylase [Gammaproteobacteria bacterium]|nr:DNA methylase [Gammaproteobacteria bacterium]
MNADINTLENYQSDKCWHGLFQRPEELKQDSTNSLPCNEILHGDCISVMKGFPNSSVNLIVTDPPYLVNYQDRMGRSIQNDVNSDWIKPAFKQAWRVLKDNSFCVSFYGDTHIDVFMSAWKEAGFRPVGHIVWPKTYASSSYYLARHHEQAFLLAKGYPQKPQTVLPDIQEWAYTGNKLHPTQKSVDVIKPLINSFSNVGDLVLDPFSGSGTTALAAKQTGRNYIGIELEDNFVEISRNRLI